MSSQPKGQDSWLQEALAHHQRGDLVQAESLYRRLLEQNDDHADAGSLLGTIRIQQGRFRDGVALLEKVLSKTPQHPVAQANLALAYHELGDLPHAIAHYRRAIALDGGSDEAVNNLACALRESGQLDEAKALLVDVVQRESKFAPAHYNLGLIYKTRGDLAAAVACYRRAVALRPNYADAHFNLGNALSDQGRLDESLAAFDAAIAAAPQYAPAWDNRGLVLARLRRYDEALASHERAIAIAPNAPEAYCNLGSLYDQLGRKEESLTCFRRALELKPDYIEVWCNIAHTLTQQGNAEEAVACCDRALAVNPNLFMAHLNRGAALLEWGRDEEASAELAWCAARDPKHLSLLINRGTLAASSGNTAQALEYYRAAVEVEPNDAMAQWNYALARLASGDFAGGWSGYDWGLKTTQRSSVARYRLPRWQGEDICDKTLLVVAEQGVGDEMQLASCLLDVAARAKRVVVQCDPRLVTLYRRSFPHLVIHGAPRNAPPDWLETVGGADVASELGSLPRFVRPRLEDFSGKTPYLRPDAERVAFWRARLAQLGTKPKVGLAWRSRLTGNRRSRHYPCVADVVPLLRTSGVTFINLQYDDCESELAQLRAQSGADIRHFDDIDLFNNLDDSAALISALDLVIAPSTSTFVIAGSTGTPCWQMCPCPMEAWLFGRDDHAWFSQARLYRQRRAFQWDEVVGAITRDLSAWAQSMARGTSASQPSREAALRVHQTGDLIAACEMYQALLERAPDDAELLMLYGTAQTQRGQLDEGEALLQRAAILAPHAAQVWNNVAFVYQRRGALADEIRAYQTAVECDASFAPGWSNLANALLAAGRADEAIAALNTLLRLEPHTTEHHYRMGKARQAQVNRAAARDAFGAALVIAPDHAASLNDLGYCHYEDGNYAEAERYFSRALQAQPDFVAALVNMGSARMRQGDAVGAEHYFRRAVAHKEAPAQAHHNLSLVLLAQGQLDEGWREWMWRKNVDNGAGFAPIGGSIPLWHREPLPQQTLLVHGEQGIGDEILFASCVPDVAAHVERVILQCDERLAPLFARSFPTVTVHGAPRASAAGWSSQFAPVHAQCPSGDLPSYFRRDLKSFGRNNGYLRADPARVAYWRSKFDALGAGRKVGVAWRSHYLEANRGVAYFDLTTLRPALQVPGVVWINLQYGDCTDEIAAMAKHHGCTVHHFAEIDLFNDFDEAAAYMTALDAVVSPEMATYNLAGALGVKTWLLLGRVPKRAWVTLGTRGVPWYPSVTIVQQDEQRDFAMLANGVAEAVRAWIHSSKQPSAATSLIGGLLGPGAVVVTVDPQNASDRIDDQRISALDLLHIRAGVAAAAVLVGATQTVSRLRPWLLIDGVARLGDDELAGVLHGLGYRVMSQAALGQNISAPPDNQPSYLVCCPVPMPSRDNPSPRYRQLLAFYQRMHTQGYDRVVNGSTLHTRPEEAFPGNELPLFAQPIKQLIGLCGARTLLDYGAGKGQQYEWPLTVEGRAYPSVRAYWDNVEVQCYEPALGAAPLAVDARFDGVVCTDVLEHIAEADIPWVLNELFSRARHFVFASIACFEALALLPDGSNAHCTVHPPAWWQGVLNVVAARHSHVRFLIAFGLPPHSGVPDDTVWFDNLKQVSAKLAKG